MIYFGPGFFARAAPLILVSLVAGPAMAQSAAGPTCVTLNTITSGAILNGHEMRFELRDGTKLVARLARDCPQLEFHGRFTYEAPGGRLCTGEGRIVARSGAACLISSFSPEIEPPPADDAPTSNPADSH